MKPKLALCLFCILLFALNISCESKQDSFFAASLSAGEPLIVLSGGRTATSVNTSISLYDIRGNFLRILADYASVNSRPRGLAPYDPFHFIVAINGNARLDKVSLFGEVTPFASDANFAGNIFGMTRDGDGNFYVVESNTIEKFSPTGVRVPISGTAPYIPTTLGACVLSTPHGVIINAEGHLVAVSSGNSRLKIYDISESNPTCVDTHTYTGTQIWDIVQHPNGYMYFVAQATAALYRVNVDGTDMELLYDYSPNTLNPGAIAVLPDGNLLVALHSTTVPRVDLFDPEGNMLQEGFITGTLTFQANSILIMGGQ